MDLKEKEIDKESLLGLAGAGELSQQAHSPMGTPYATVLAEVLGGNLHGV